CLQYDSRPFTF
nr:immunoglobulin light chain junction region [Macaca mulatta]